LKDVGAVKKVKQVQYRVEGKGNIWICLDIPIENLGLDELELEEAFFEELRNKVGCAGGRDGDAEDRYQRVFSP
jgi:hypothetical protein